MLVGRTGFHAANLAAEIQEPIGIGPSPAIRFLTRPNAVSSILAAVGLTQVKSAAANVPLTCHCDC